MHHSASGKFAIREGEWVFIDSPNGGEVQEPEWYREERGYVPHDCQGELFNLKDDLSERQNQYDGAPELVERLSARLGRIKAGEDAQASDATEEEPTE